MELQTYHPTIIFFYPFKGHKDNDSDALLQKNHLVAAAKGVARGGGGSGEPPFCAKLINYA